MRIFSRVADEWNETGEFAGRLIREIPVKRKDWKERDVKGEDVRFEYQRFLQWLTGNPANIEPPKAGYMLKYFADTGETESIPTGRQHRKEDEDISGLHVRESQQPERIKWAVISAALLLVVNAGLILFVLQKKSNEASQKATQAEKKNDVSIGRQRELGYHSGEYGHIDVTA